MPLDQLPYQEGRNPEYGWVWNPPVPSGGDVRPQLTVTISGPMASGKTLLAQAIAQALDDAGVRASQTFLEVNAGRQIVFVEEQTS